MRKFLVYQPSIVKAKPKAVTWWKYSSSRTFWKKTFWRLLHTECFQKTGVTMFWHLTPKLICYLTHGECFATDREYVIQLPEASAVCDDECSSFKTLQLQTSNFKFVFHKIANFKICISKYAYQKTHFLLFFLNPI